MNAKLLGIGTALPRNFVDQRAAAQIALGLVNRSPDDGWHIEEVYLSAGIEKRHSVVLEGAGCLSTTQTFFPTLEATVDLSDRHGPSTSERMGRYFKEAVPLAMSAAQKALERAEVDPGQIDHLVTVTCTGFIAPGVDCALIEELNLSRDVSRTQVGFMGCHGAFNGLRTARSLAIANPGSTVLMVAVELCSIHFDYGWDLTRVIANSLFSDGAGAAVIRADANSSAEGWTLAANGSHVVAKTEDAMTWKVGDCGFEMSLSRKVPTLICKHLKPWLCQWLKKHDLEIDDIKTWAVHPGGPSILHAAEKAIPLPAGQLDVSREVLREFGNMSSPTILFVLERLQEEGAQLPCVALGFGPGLTIEAMLWR